MAKLCRNKGKRARESLLEFEKLIRDAIALLIKRGEIKIPRKKLGPSPPTSEKSDPPV